MSSAGDGKEGGSDAANVGVEEQSVQVVGGAVSPDPGTAMSKDPTERVENCPSSADTAAPRGALPVASTPEAQRDAPEGFIRREDMPQPPPLEQQALLLGEVPNLAEVPLPSKTEFNPPIECGDETGPWASFLNLKKATGGTVYGMMSFYDQVMKLQVTHEKEAASYRDAAEKTVATQRMKIDALTSECRLMTTRNEHMKSTITKTNQQLRQFEVENSELNRRLREIEQRCAHVEDRAVISECGRKMLEIRNRELELSLNYSTEIVNKLRKSLSEANSDKNQALQEQYNVYEANRRDMIEFYDKRERELVREFNETVAKLQDIMYNAIKVHEEKLHECWKDMERAQQEKHEQIVKDLNLLREKEEKDYHARVTRIEQDNQRRYEQYRNEMTLLEQRQKEREEHLLVDISQRERELSEREQRLRVQRAQDEQDNKVALLARETELKAYYERLMDNMRTSFDKEREKMTKFFHDQLQEISQLHLDNERKLEATHRDKEREMAQRYRVAGYEADDRKGDAELRDVSMATQSALLSKFDIIEARQRERAEKARAAFQGKDGKQ